MKQNKLPDIASLVADIASTAKAKTNNEQIKLNDVQSVQAVKSSIKIDETKPIRDNVLLMLKEKKEPIDILQTALLCISMMANNEEFYRKSYDLLQEIRNGNREDVLNDPDFFPLADNGY